LRQQAAGCGISDAPVRARDAPAAEGIAARVVDCYSAKPIDPATLVACCRATGGQIVVTEDHYATGASVKQS